MLVGKARGGDRGRFSREEPTAAASHQLVRFTPHIEPITAEIALEATLEVAR